MPLTINRGYEDVPLSLLTPHPRNVNQGDLGAISESIAANGFYGTIVANRRTGHIIAGNHRFLAAKAHRYATIPTVWVDVSDEEEIRILLADNRTTRLGMDDTASLAELLAELATTETGLTGIGYSPDDLQALIDGMTAPMFTESLPVPAASVTCPQCGHQFTSPGGQLR